LQHPLPHDVRDELSVARDETPVSRNPRFEETKRNGRVFGAVKRHLHEELSDSLSLEKARSGSVVGLARYLHSARSRAAP